MKTFRYKAISPDNIRVSGVIKAYDEYEAVAKLRETCSIVTGIEEVTESKAAGTVSSKKTQNQRERACSDVLTV